MELPNFLVRVYRDGRIEGNYWERLTEFELKKARQRTENWKSPEQRIQEMLAKLPVCRASRVRKKQGRARSA